MSAYRVRSAQSAGIQKTTEAFGTFCTFRDPKISPAWSRRIYPQRVQKRHKSTRSTWYILDCTIGKAYARYF